MLCRRTIERGQAGTVTIPDLLSGFRIAAVPGLLALAFTGQGGLFLILLAASFISDLADGFIARRLGQTSEAGTRLDSWGDLATFLALPVCAVVLWPEIMRREAVFVGIAVGCFVVPAAVGFLKFRRLTSYHTWADKVSAVLMAAAIILLFGFDLAWPFRAATAVFAVASVEEMAITLVLREARSNVATLVHALRLRRGDVQPPCHED